MMNEIGENVKKLMLLGIGSGCNRRKVQRGCG